MRHNHFVFFLIISGRFESFRRTLLSSLFSLCFKVDYLLNALDPLCLDPLWFCVGLTVILKEMIDTEQISVLLTTFISYSVLVPVCSSWISLDTRRLCSGDRSAAALPLPFFLFELRTSVIRVYLDSDVPLASNPIWGFR